MNDKGKREKVLEEFLGYKKVEAAGVITHWQRGGGRVWTIDYNFESWLIAAISTRFAELGRVVFPQITNQWYIIESYYVETSHQQKTIGRGTTPCDAWIDAALNEEGKTP